MRSFSIMAIIGILLLTSLVRAKEIDYSRDVLPILSDKCFQCHGPDKKTREADLRLDTFEGAVADLGGYAALVPEKPDKSELIFRIDDKEDPMPPRKTHLTLTEAEKQVLREWIREG